jgi:hypothetical protein
VVLVGPSLFAGDSASNPYGCSCFCFGKPIARALARIDPKGPGIPVSIDAITTNKDEIGTIRLDPLYFDLDILNKTGQEVFKMADVCRENVPSFTVSSSHTA